jgi:hypothetical protein
MTSVLFRARIFAAPAETLPDLHVAQDAVHQKNQKTETARARWCNERASVGSVNGAAFAPIYLYTELAVKIRVRAPKTNRSAKTNRGNRRRLTPHEFRLEGRSRIVLVLLTKNGRA